MTSITTTAPVTMRGTSRRPLRTRALLNLSVAAGPVFAVVTAMQAVGRDGFDLRRHPLSQLATGDLGFVQIINFVLAGIGVLCLAVAQRRIVTDGVGRRWLARMVGGFGVGLVAAGIFPMDPQDGFPVGAPAGPAAQMSWHGVAHSVAAAAAFTSLAAACIVFTVRKARQRAALPAVLSATAALVFLLPVIPGWASIQVAINGLVAFSWTTAVALGLRKAFRAVAEEGVR
jgi:Protein of unknown function (DUF998)